MQLQKIQNLQLKNTQTQKEKDKPDPKSFPKVRNGSGAESGDGVIVFGGSLKGSLLLHKVEGLLQGSTRPGKHRLKAESI